MNGKAFSLSLVFFAMLLALSACWSGGNSAQGQIMNNGDKAKTTQPMMQNNEKNKSPDQDSEKAPNKTNDKMNQAKGSDMDQKQGSMDSNKNSTTKKNQSDAHDHVLNVTAHNFAFNKKKFVVQHGKITIHFKSIQGTHGFAVYKSPGSTKKLVNIVGKGTKTVTLQPGKYYIHCSVVCGEGHGQMEATLLVK